MKLIQIVNLSYILLSKTNLYLNKENITRKLLIHNLKINENKYFFYLNYEISNTIFEKIIFNLKRIIYDKTPLEHIIGYCFFYNQKFFVNKNVLIPRPETEELVCNTIKIASKIFKDKIINFADICSGSGAISVAFYKNYPFIINKAYTVDISEKSIEILKKNITINKCNINVFCGNLLDPLIKNQIKVDVLISNPPYLKKDENIQDSVLKHEPHIALFAKNLGIEFYIKIIQDIIKVVNKKFLIAFEIGPQQANILYYIFRLFFSKDVNIHVKKDLQKRKRMIFIYN